MRKNKKTNKKTNYQSRKSFQFNLNFYSFFSLFKIDSRSRERKLRPYPLLMKFPFHTIHKLSRNQIKKY